MMNYLPVCAMVLSVMVFEVVKGDCITELNTCLATLAEAAGSTEASVCAAITAYQECAKAACFDLISSELDTIMNNAIAKAGLKCGSTMLYVSVLHVMLVAIASVLFNYAA